MIFPQADKSKIKLVDGERNQCAETVIKTHEGVQELIIQEESTGQAKAEEQQSNEQTEAYTRQMGDNFCTAVVSVTF